MKFPRLDLLVLPRTLEGYRGAFFGTLLSLFLDCFGVTSAIVAIVAFGVGVFCSPLLRSDETPEASTVTPEEVDRIRNG